MTSKQDFSHHRSEEGATTEAQTIGQLVTALQGAWGALMLPMAALLSFPGTLPKCTMDTSINTQRWIQKQYLGNLLYIQGISPRTACSHHNCKKHQNCQCKAQVSQWNASELRQWVGSQVEAKPSQGNRPRKDRWAHPCFPAHRLEAALGLESPKATRSGSFSPCAPPWQQSCWVHSWDHMGKNQVQIPLTPLFSWETWRIQRCWWHNLGPDTFLVFLLLYITQKAGNISAPSKEQLAQAGLHQNMPFPGAWLC